MERSYFFVRHGRAVYQERGFSPRAHPRGTDWPLSPVGHGQAVAVTGGLLASGVERVVSSALFRARQTATHIAAEGRVPYEHVWPELDELRPRSLRDRARRRGPEWLEGVAMARAMRRHARGAPTPGWRVEEVASRVRAVLARLDAMDEPRIAVVGHGYWILMAAVLLDGPPRYRWIDNCSVTRIDADGRGRHRLIAFARPITERRAIR